jgi:hypothetical protein
VTKYLLQVVASVGAVGLSVALALSNLGNAGTPEEFTLFEGYYGSAFEASNFLPCGVEGPPSPGKGYWLRAEPQSGFFDQYESIVGTVIPQPERGRRFDFVIVYVRFEGELAPEKSKPGSGYGHLGMYSKMVTVKKIYEMRLPVGNECRK